MPKRAAKPSKLPSRPMSPLEDEARAFALVWLAAVSRTPLFNSPYEPLDPAMAHWYVRDVGKQFVASHPLNAARMVEAAVQGSREAHEVLIELIAEKNERGEPLGASLGVYNNIRLENPKGSPRTRGKSKVTNMVQDIFIAELVTLMVAQFPALKATRSQVGRQLQPSACSIVADILARLGLHRGDERAIRIIWKRYELALTRSPPNTDWWRDLKAKAKIVEV